MKHIVFLGSTDMVDAFLCEDKAVANELHGMLENSGYGRACGGPNTWVEDVDGPADVKESDFESVLTADGLAELDEADIIDALPQSSSYNVIIAS